MGTTLQSLVTPSLSDIPSGPAQILAFGNAVEKQIIQVYATSTARDAAVTAPVAGMVAYLSTPKQMTTYDGSTWRVSGQPGGWTDVASPVITQSATPTFTTNYAAYEITNRTLRYQGLVTITGTPGTAGNAVRLGLPATLRAAAITAAVRNCGTGVVFDTSAGAYYPSLAVPVTTTAIQFKYTGSTSANYIGAADFTAALATGDTVSWDITAELA